VSSNIFGCVISLAIILCRVNKRVRWIGKKGVFGRHSTSDCYPGRHCAYILIFLGLRMSEADKNNAPQNSPFQVQANGNPKKSLDLVQGLLNGNILIHRHRVILKARQFLTSRTSTLDIDTTMGSNEVPVRCRGRTVHVVQFG
jgi:hypothetical protein